MKLLSIYTHRFFLYVLNCYLIRTFSYLFPKKQAVIRGELIYYREVPTRFLMGGAFFICHGSPKTTSIFISKKSLFPRLTVFHEHCESLAMKNRRSFEDILDYVRPRLFLMAEVYGDRPDINNGGLKRSDEFLLEWIARNGFHAEALIRQIELAKEELSAEELVIFFGEIRKHNRFAILPS